MSQSGHRDVENRMSLPSWAIATSERRAHIARVADLVTHWASAMRVPDTERARWLKAAWLHDALRDAPAANELAHGPMAAERAAREGETDRGVLDAVRYHSIGYASWENVGKMLYLADYLEPGRPFDQPRRAALAARGDRRGRVWKRSRGARQARFHTHRRASRNGSRGTASASSVGTGSGGGPAGQRPATRRERAPGRGRCAAVPVPPVAGRRPR